MFYVIILSLIIIFCIYVPGLLLFSILFPQRKLNFIESLSVFFTLGLSFYILPSTVSYILHLSWTSFSIILISEIVLIAVFIIIKKKNIIQDLFAPFDKYDLILLLLISVIANVMYLNGGCFYADSAAHLSSITKLASLDIIDPYVAMFKDAKEVSYGYAYCIWYVVFAFFYKISGIDLKILWDISPAVFSPFISSAVYFLSGKLINRKEFVFTSVIIFYLYEFTFFWFDFKFLPIPDQIARNIFLCVGLGSFFYKAHDKRDAVGNAVLLGLTACLTTLTHMYAFFAFFIIGSLYCLALFINKSEIARRKQFLMMYASAFAINLPFLIIRILFSNYFASEKYLNFLVNVLK